jgi:hypothetical protein
LHLPCCSLSCLVVVFVPVLLLSLGSAPVALPTPLCVFSVIGVCACVCVCVCI